MQGLMFAIAAYCIWGGFPLYFSYLSEVSPVEVLTHRIIWSVIATLLIGLLLGRGARLCEALQDSKLRAWLALSSLLIAINWLVFIWAVGQHHVLEASLGYFITPVMSLLLARLLLKETLHPLQAWAGIVAALAVIWELYSLGRLPWIGLTLALAFALYGVIRKRHPVDGINGLTIETLWLLPPALAWLGWQAAEPTASLAFGSDTQTTLLLIGSGLLTALPLVLFAMAARRVDLSVVGFIMYINPTIQFLIGVFVLKEAYPPQRMVTFALIWFALSLFLAGLWQSRQVKSANS
jgi:chloramphenicol-sensitive protein RarD